MRSLILVALGAVALSACAAETEPGFTDADRAEIAAVTEQAIEIANTSQDWTRYTEVYYAPDAIVMPPNEEVIRGREAMAEWLATFPPMSTFEATQVQVDGAGDIAYVYGTYFMAIAMTEGEEPVPDEGKYLEIWRRQADGGWKIIMDIFNSDMPLPEG